MIWWWWCILGLLLLALELFAVEAQFYLVFAGLAALVTGGVDYLWMGSTSTTEWLLFAALSLVFMVTIRRRLYEQLVAHLPERVGSDLDRTVTIAHTLAPGQTTRVEYRGTQWTARNDGERAILAGTEVRITAIDGLTLHVRG